MLFLQSAWSAVMLLPAFASVSEALYLIGYVVSSIDEQKQEFAVMRAIGGRPALVVRILAFQISTLLLSGFGIRVSLGIVTTLSLLMANPLVMSGAILKIAVWLLLVLAALFTTPLIPAFRISKAQF